MDGTDDGLMDIEAPPLPPPRKVYDFYVTTSGGMEDIAVAEIKRRLGQVSQVRIARERRLSRIFFHYERSPKKLLDLRSIEQVYVLLADIVRVTVGQPGLLHIAQRVAEVDLISGAVLHDILHGPKDEVGFRLSCTTGKGHRFSASELHHVVKTVLTMKYEVDEDVGRPYGLHLRVQGDRALFGLQLKSHRENNADLAQIRGDLPASVGFGLAQLAHIRQGDVVLGICCGGGTALVEAGLETPPKQIIGVDWFLDAATALKENATVARASAYGVVGDGGMLPIKSDTIHKIIANLMPRTGMPGVVLQPLLLEMVRVLQPKGQAVVVFEDRRVMERVLDDVHALRLVKRRPLHVQGKHPHIFILQCH